jgi:hypothetical protein
MTVRLFAVFVLGLAVPAFAQTPTGGPAGTYYIVTTPMTAYEKPDVKSAVLDKIAPLTYVGVQERLPNGWIRFKIRKASAGIVDLIVDPAKSTFDAYVRAESDDNYIAAEQMDAVRIEKIAKTSWPAAVKNDAARKRVQAGFTEEQVVLTLGEPTERVSSVWVYSKPLTIIRTGKNVTINEQRITFAGGVVQSVAQK